MKNLRAWHLPFWLLVILSMMVLVSCWSQEYVPSGPIVYSHDSWVKDGTKGGPQMEISGFQWRYLGPTDQIYLKGETINNGSKPLQSVRIFIDAFDQYNYHLGSSETYLNPTYIEPGSKATFEFYVPRGEWVQNIRLRYRIDTRIN